MQSNLRSVDLNLLVVLDAILEEHSLSGAAERLNMTQPAVSNALARLRLTFKDALFVRSRYGMEPTPRAVELMEPIKQALSIIQDTVDERNIFDPGSSTRTFHIALNDQGEERLLPDLLQVIEGQSRSIKVESHSIFEGGITERLITNRLDFAFGHQKPRDKRIGFEQLALDPLVVIVSKQHPRVASKITKKAFFSEKHIILKHRLGQKTLMETILGEKLANREVLAEVQNLNSLVQVVSKTEAIAIVSAGAVDTLKQTLAIKALPLPFKVGPIPYYLLWSKARENDQGYLWFKRQILSDLTP